MKNFLGFLIVPILLFNYLFLLPTPLLAQVNTSADINYSYLDSLFKVEIPITLKNTSRTTSVVNYYTILLPYESIKNLKVSMTGRTLGVTQYKQKDGIELIINFKSLVLNGRDSAKFKIAFDSSNLIDTDWGYAKFISQISGLATKKVTLEYEKDKPEVFKVDGAKVSKVESNNRMYEFTSITDGQLSVNFGKPTTFEYEFVKLYINDSNEAVVNEVALPYSDTTQQLIITSVSPAPITKRIDGDGNLMLGFLVEKEEQEQVIIKGYIIKEDLSFTQEYKDSDLDTLGFWDITNQFELIRLENYLKSKSQIFTPHNASNYVVNRLKPQTQNNISGSTSFENALRGGADVAIGRKDLAVPEDYVDLLIGILRKKSVPTRMVVGFLPQSHPLLSSGSFHSWVEYFDVKEKKWLSLDPSIQDIYKVANFEANVVNSVKLINRSSNPNLPKLPFLNAKDLKIKPVGNTSEVMFDVIQERNTFINSGNVPVKVSNGSIDEVLLPGESKEFNTPGSALVSTLYGDSEKYEIENNSVLPEHSTSLLSEILVFLGFITILLGGNYLYLRLRKIKKG